MQATRPRASLLIALLAALVLGAWHEDLLSSLPWPGVRVTQSESSAGRGEETSAPGAPRSPGEVSQPDPFTWHLALARVEEVRGSAGIITVPPELRHYEDRRRFLALQMADSEEQGYELPHDQAEMILRGELVELSPLADDYILYEVGTDAREDPLAHYDEASGKDVPHFASAAAYEAEDTHLARIAEGRGREAAAAREKRAFLESFYRDPARSQQLYREHAAVTALAADFGGTSYDLALPEDRGRFQARLLSFIRLHAKGVLLTLAEAYHARFGRLLPVTSLVRTERYQQRLARVNRNATTVEVPPHATGMAFDISYKFMAPDEQNFVMGQVARLEVQGRVEALRERTNHFHVYAFADGQRPAELRVAQMLDDVEAAHPQAPPKKPKPAPRASRPGRRAGASGRGR